MNYKPWMLVMVTGMCAVLGLFFYVRTSPSTNPALTPAEQLNTSVTSTNGGSSTSTGTAPTTVQTIRLQNGRTLKLSLPSEYVISVAAQGYQRLRFMALSPDKRLFVGEMESANDSQKGSIEVFDQLDPQSQTFKKATKYLTNLRNPHSLAFYTDPNGQSWLYIALTDKLVRYKYTLGDLKPSGEAQLVTTFPDYGRPWSAGGWHITRTVVVDDQTVYVSVGSSCNSCEEKPEEPSRAAILSMNPDGSNLQVIAKGLRNAVGLQVINHVLYAAENGPDHLGTDKPEDAFFAIKPGTDYGWPYCYRLKGKIYPDNSQPWQRAIDCQTVPLAQYGFLPHSAPLGFDVFDGQFLVAIHGSGNKSLGVGYKVMSLDQQTYQASDFITGFLDKGVVNGRPAGILKYDEQRFLVTDDFNGALYLVSKK